MSQLSERKWQILKAVIDEHISAGEPVGSKLLSQNQQIALSSATIRNELAELTEMGYLLQPHTSAGRIPSEQGYRYYVDMLLHDYDSASMEIEGLRELLKERTNRLDKIIDDAGKLVSSLTHYPAIAVRSFRGRESVKKYNLMPLDSHSFMMVMLINEANIKTKRVGSMMALDEEALSYIQKVLNKYLVNVMPDVLTYAQIREFEGALGAYGELASVLIKSIYDALSEGEGSEMRVEGVDRFLEYPEYSSVDRLRSMLSMLSGREGILELVENSSNDGVNVFIGSENLADSSGESTLVFRTITVAGKPIGAIGVVGPCRMDYMKVISTVEQLSKSIADMIENGRSLPDGKQSNTGGN